MSGMLVAFWQPHHHHTPSSPHFDLKRSLTLHHLLPSVLWPGFLMPQSSWLCFCFRNPRPSPAPQPLCKPVAPAIPGDLLDMWKSQIQLQACKSTSTFLHSNVIPVRISALRNPSRPLCCARVSRKQEEFASLSTRWQAPPMLGPMRAGHRWPCLV